jgi:hypothetical protein
LREAQELADFAKEEQPLGFRHWRLGRGTGMEFIAIISRRFPLDFNPLMVNTVSFKPITINKDVEQ